MLFHSSTAVCRTSLLNQMLKWAVIRKASEDESKSHLVEKVFYDDAIQISANKFRRHSNKFNNHNAEIKSTSTFYSKQNKEKCFTSTPVKMFQNRRIVFRDVSNQTLKNLNGKIIKKRNMQQNTCLRPSKTSSFDMNSEKQSFKFHNKCTLKLNNFLNYKSPFRKSNVEPLELEKSHVQKFSEQHCTCKSKYNYSSLRSDGYDYYYYSPTLPTLEIEDSHISVPPDLNLNLVISEHYSTENFTSDHEYDQPLKKKFRYDSINSSKICGVPFNTDEKTAFAIDKVNRVKQLINFNKIIVDEERHFICKEVNRSCSPNELTLNIIVYTMIQKSSNPNDLSEINKLCKKYSGLLINLEVGLQKLRNELNETREEILGNTLYNEKKFNASINSLNSELISTKTNCLYEKKELSQRNIIDIGSKTLNKEIKIKSEKEICRVTAATIDITNTCLYDEKYADRGRKRSYSTLSLHGLNTIADQEIECDSDTKCSLKRQNCVRRIKR